MVDIKAADARLAAAIQQRMAKGGEVDIKAADARLSAAIAQRMATGGIVDIHPRVHEILNAPSLPKLGVGGLLKGMGKKLADNVLPAAERELNKTAVKLGDKVLPVTMHPIEAREGNVMANVNPQTFDKAFKKTQWQYVGPQGEGGIGERYKKFGEFVETAPSMNASNVSVDKTGKVTFGDGRHRYAYLRDQGVDSIPMSMDKESIENAKLHGLLSEKNKAHGGTVQHFDGGGMAMGEDPYVTKPERFTDLKKTAAEMYEDAKRELSRLKSPEARAQLAKIAAAQIAGGVPDLAHLGVDLVLDPLKSVTVDKLLTKPKARSVLESAASTTSPRLADQPQREPMFGSISEALKTKDGLPIGGSEHIIRRAQDAGLMYGKDLVDEKGEAMIDPETGAPLRSGRFSPLMEIGASVLGGAGASKVARGALKAAQGFGKGFDKGYARAMSKQEPPFLNELGYDSALDKQPVKLLGQQPRVMTALPGTPQGATYATRQEGPFYRVSPTTLDVSKAKTRGIREGDELQGQAPVGGSTGQAGREVPQRISDEEVARIISNPETNQPLQVAQKFTKDTQGTDFVRPDIPESSLAKQSAIGRAHQLAVEGSPEYKTSVFDAYAKQMPEVLEQSGAKNYDDLMEKAYRQLAKETDQQFQQLLYNFSYHRKGEGDYLGGSKEMMSDVHGNKHLYVFQGGDPHDFLNRVDKATGLNENEKFRAVHDLLGHAIYGNQFGPKGEEIAWAVHQQMYSPLARLAMTAETRGQNSLVNYSPLNVKVKSAIATLDDIEAQALRKGDKALVNEIRAAKRQEYSNNFQFAPQKAVLLPPEFISPKFAGGLPDYLNAANKPTKGTQSQSALTHFSNSPELQFLDPKRYGTGIKGAEAKRLNEYEGGVKDRSYVYLGEPGTVSPEPGLGINRYRGESSNLYDITKDPLNFRALARESNRTPFTSKVNAGVTSPLQEANDYERLVKEYGYEGMMNPNASKPMGIMFKPTAVQPRKRGGLTQSRAR